jgi:hypothetical protein
MRTASSSGPRTLTCTRMRRSSLRKTRAVSGPRVRACPTDWHCPMLHGPTPGMSPAVRAETPSRAPRQTFEGTWGSLRAAEQEKFAADVLEALQRAFRFSDQLKIVMQRGRDDSKPFFDKGRDNEPPCLPGLRESVKKDDRSFSVAGSDVVKPKFRPQLGRSVYEHFR